MSNNFDKFILFGSIGNGNIRKNLADKTFKQYYKWEQ